MLLFKNINMIQDILVRY